MSLDWNSAYHRVRFQYLDGTSEEKIAGGQWFLSSEAITRLHRGKKQHLIRQRVDEDIPNNLLVHVWQEVKP